MTALAGYRVFKRVQLLPDFHDQLHALVIREVEVVFSGIVAVPYAKVDALFGNRFNGKGKLAISQAAVQIGKVLRLFVEGRLGADTDVGWLIFPTSSVKAVEKTAGMCVFASFDPIKRIAFGNGLPADEAPVPVGIGGCLQGMLQCIGEKGRMLHIGKMMVHFFKVRRLIGQANVEAVAYGNVNFKWQ